MYSTELSLHDLGSPLSNKRVKILLYAGTTLEPLLP